MHVGNRQDPPQVGGDAPKSLGKAAFRWVCTTPLVAGLRASQKSRRSLVFAFLAVVAAFPLVAWLTGQMALVLAVLVLYLVTLIMLGGATYGLLDRPLHSLDERQLHLRRTIFREPYFTGAALGLVGGLAMAAALNASDALLMGWTMSIMALLFGLPLLVLAWRLPDDPHDDAE